MKLDEELRGRIMAEAYGTERAFGPSGLAQPYGADVEASLALMHGGKLYVARGVVISIDTRNSEFLREQIITLRVGPSETAVYDL